MNQKNEDIEPQNSSTGNDKQVFPVVGMGASAGGLGSFEAFFEHFTESERPGMAFVLVQHLDPERKSLLPELIQKSTWMPVLQVQDDMPVEPDHVYVIPPNKYIALFNGHLQLIDPTDPHSVRLPIDYFFRSLAQDQGEFAVGIVLSGTGSDGALGAKAIKEVGGLVMVQDPHTCQHNSMPRAVVEAGLADLIMPAEDLAAQLVAYAENFYDKKVTRPLPEPSPSAAASYRKIFRQLRNASGIDFTHYKTNTIQRRIERRMALHQINRLDLYVQFLENNPEEVDSLYRDLLIGVTNFFRDPDAFVALKEKVIPKIFPDKPSGSEVRVWVPGCSTGEEAYSIAILLWEQLESTHMQLNLRIYATDVDERAIEQARSGKFLPSIRADLIPERFERFFLEENGYYRIAKFLREKIIFARQDIVADPPFSRLDLITCRNMLIYMDADLKKKIIPLFHYALNPGGFLFLGSSESIGEYVNLFEALDNKWKIYQRRAGVATTNKTHQFPHAYYPIKHHILDEEREGDEDVNLKAWTERMLLEEHTPACVIVNERSEVLYIHGRTGKYLEPSQGEASLNLFKMARPGLNLGLNAALHEALKRNGIIHYKDVQVQTNGETIIIDLTVKPLDGPGELHRSFMVIFEDEDRHPEDMDMPHVELSKHPDQRLVELERQLSEVREHLESVVEQLETSNEELISTNEELHSANEELQSANEELETSKEQSQSINEELIMVNTELTEKVRQLSQVNDDLNNLMTVSGIGTIFVDMDMKITRYTSSVSDVISLIDGDVGRPLEQIAPKLRYDGLVKDVQHVLDTLHEVEVEVQSRSGDWYLMRVQPYRTIENVIQGAVITFMDISDLKENEQRLETLMRQNEETREFVESILDTVQDSLVVLDGELRIVSVNQAFYDTFLVKPSQTVGKRLYDLGNRQWDIPGLRTLLEEILPEKNSFNDYCIQHEFEHIGYREMVLNARELKREDGRRRLILLAIRDTTIKKMS